MGEALKRRIQQFRFDSPALEAMLNLLVAAGHIRQRSDAVCEQFGIGAAQYNVLRILRGVHPQGHPRREIARRLLDRHSDVTRLVDRLEASGLAERARSPEDRRLSVTRITCKGLDLLESMEAPMSGVVAYFAERVSRRDCRELSRICEGIYEEGAEE